MGNRVIDRTAGDASPPGNGDIIITSGPNGTEVTQTAVQMLHVGTFQDPEDARMFAQMIANKQNGGTRGTTTP